jgi:hypothetical protein
MALFSTAVDTCLYSFSIRRFLFRSTVAPLRCCQPKKLGASLAKRYSPKCLEEGQIVVDPETGEEAEEYALYLCLRCAEEARA